MSDQSDLEQFASADSGGERQPAERESEEPDPEEHGTARFPSLPTDWEIKRLDEVATVQGGSTPSTDEDEYWGGDIPWATPTDLTELQGNTISDTEDKITEAGLESTSTHVLPPYSVLLTSRASIGKCAVNTVPMATNQGFQSLIPGEKLNTWYLYYVITEMAPYLESLGAGSTFSEISKRVVQRVQIPVPPMEEQLRIATIMDTIDQKIRTTGKSLQYVNRVKRGVMEYLFTEGYENHPDYSEGKYGEYPAAWDVINIDEGAVQIQAGGTPSTDKPEYYGGEIPWVKTGELSQRRITETEEMITQEGLENSTARLFSPGTVLVAMYGATTGEVAMLETEATTNQACCGIVTDYEILNSRFLYHQLEYFKRQLASLGAGSGQQNISKGIIQKFDIYAPPIQEQGNIAAVLDTFDEKAEMLIKEKNRLKTVRNGVREDLITGNIRVDDRIQIVDEVRVNG